MPLSELQVPSSAQGGIITIGNFDGVHRGHQAMLASLRTAAGQGGFPAVALTFDPHPVTVLNPEIRLPRLTSIQTRTRLLKKFGADEVVVLPVNRQLLDMNPEDFFHRVVCDQLSAAGMFEGPDFRFGKDRRGDVDVLRHLCAERGMTLFVQQAVRAGEDMISSTRIRRMMESADFNGAVELLGHPYTISGLVEKGSARGRTIGFPTANLSAFECLLPADGVYAARCCLDGRDYAAALNIGANPTFREGSRKVECHIAGFSGDLYGRRLNVDILRRLRKLRRFEGEQALKEAIERDVSMCRDIFRDAQE
ncbi:MAG: riboflavin biosynthesis protein RibF [Fuerstiella sp.]